MAGLTGKSVSHKRFGQISGAFLIHAGQTLLGRFVDRCKAAQVESEGAIFQGRFGGFPAAGKLRNR
jgi:hypothetical protein